jgi:homocysteine S-methyltransferase
MQQKTLCGRTRIDISFAYFSPQSMERSFMPDKVKFPATGRYRSRLPQTSGELFLTDGGIETTLVFQHGAELPYFASFVLLNDALGRELLRHYFTEYLLLARRLGLGAILETPTWRCNRDWGAKLGYATSALDDLNRRSVDLLAGLRDSFAPSMTRPVVVSGNLGPRGDGYRVESCMTVEEAQAYHLAQIEAFATSEADMVTAMTMTYVEEAAGIVLAARACRMPVVISFTLETDGRLQCGVSLTEAITRTDQATNGYAAYYMINCAHPSHFADALAEPGPWRERVRGLRANASKRSHAELDESTDLDAGDPVELGQDYARLKPVLPRLSVLGGCCGTDHRHVEAVCRAFRTVGA